MSLNIEDVLDKILTHASEQAVFDTVNGHEPKSKPGAGLTCAVWNQSIDPVQTSGLNSTSVRLEFTMRIYTNMLQDPRDAIDPQVISAVDIMITSFSTDITLGGDSREIDLLGAYGIGLSAKAGYINQDGSLFRVMDITIPVILDNVWDQEV